MWIAQTIGIEGLAGLLLAAGEAHTPFSLIPFAKGCRPVRSGVSSLDAFSFLPTMSHVMSISCQLAEMMFGAWELAAGDCRAHWAFCPTLSLRELSRRAKYPDRNRRLGLLPGKSGVAEGPPSVS
jgi:hypothetical protein